MIARPVYRRSLWDAYVRVNQRFAQAAADVAAEGAVVWVQDYQLQLVPRMLRELRPDLRIGFFLHIPFPPMELFQQLPWRRQILEGLLGADLVGFQTRDGASNFVRLCRRFCDLKTQRHEVMLDDRTVRAGSFPISVDANELVTIAAEPDVQERAAQIREDLGNPGSILLGVDRLDYTKGIQQRLQAFTELFEDKRLKVGDAVFVQLATPSRERVKEYRILRDEIELQIGRANGLYAELGTPIIDYLHTSYTRRELAALYLAADVMVVTPLRDGMNLVAKEYVACRADLKGSLLLSEFAGAASELHRAFMVNPYDIAGLKNTMCQHCSRAAWNAARWKSPLHWWLPGIGRWSCRPAAAWWRNCRRSVPSISPGQSATNHCWRCDWSDRCGGFCSNKRWTYSTSVPAFPPGSPIWPGAAWIRRPVPDF